MDLVQWISVGIWAALILICAIIEVSTVNILTGLTSVSALPSLFIAIFAGDQVWSVPVEIVVGFGLWVILYFSTYKILKNWAKNHLTRYKASMEDWIGQEVDLLKDCYEESLSDHSYGKVYLDGKYFRTLADKHQGKIEKGSKVKLVKLEGVTFYVKKIQ